MLKLNNRTRKRRRYKLAAKQLLAANINIDTLLAMLRVTNGMQEVAGVVKTKFKANNADASIAEHDLETIRAYLHSIPCTSCDDIGQYWHDDEVVQCEYCHMTIKSRYNFVENLRKQSGNIPWDKPNGTSSAKN